MILGSIYVFWHPGSGFVIIYADPNLDPDPSTPEAKEVRKTLISTVLWLLYDFLSLKNDVMYKKVISKKT